MGRLHFASDFVFHHRDETRGHERYGVSKTTLRNILARQSRQKVAEDRLEFVKIIRKLLHAWSLVVASGTGGGGGGGCIRAKNERLVSFAQCMPWG